MLGKTTSFAALRAGLIVLLSVGVLATLALLATPDDWLSLASRLQPAWFAGVVVVVILIQLGETLRILALAGLPAARWLPFARVSFASASIGILPTGWLGGDIYRTYAATELGLNTGGAVSAVGLSRLLGLIATFGLTGLVIGLRVSRDPAFGIPVSLEDATVVWRAGSAVVAAAVLIVIVWKLYPRPVHAVRRFLGETWTIARATPKRGLIIGFAHSLLIASGRAMLFWFAALSVGTSLDLGLAFIASGAALIVGLVPFIGTTIGVREAVSAGVLMSLGVEPASAVAIALLSRVCSAVTCLAGWGITSAVERRFTSNSSVEADSCSD